MLAKRTVTRFRWVCILYSDTGYDAPPHPALPS